MQHMFGQLYRGRPGLFDPELRVRSRQHKSPPSPPVFQNSRQWRLALHFAAGCRDGSSERTCCLCGVADCVCDLAPLARRHCYHLQCIMQWAQRSRECPMCFKPLALEVSVHNNIITQALDSIAWRNCWLTAGASSRLCCQTAKKCSIRG